ncbi:MAG: hypothetical protein KGZ58_03040 [Ignavibacteriales bacterium]|nr:hypothetical protein [Ignavibacteriales bacterium]
MDFEEKKRGIAYPSKKVLGQYRQNVETSLHPIEVLIRTYDVAIDSLKKQDAQAARKALTELTLALNFHPKTPANVKEVAQGFYQIYKYCQSCIFRGKYDDAVKALQELRDAWEVSFRNRKTEHVNRVDAQWVSE